MRSAVLRFRSLVVIAGLAIGVAACGADGDPLPPVGADGQRGPAAPESTPPTPPKDGERPDRPFILDGLLD